ncbi:lanthionine synthetase C family protein, partial [Streptomyces sp. 12297]
APQPPPDEEPWQAQSLADGAAGTALLHIEHARRGLASWRPAHQWITQAAAGDIEASDTSSLYLGAPAVAFLLSTTPPDTQHLYQGAAAALHRNVTALAHRRTDAALARVRAGAPAEFAEYDLLHGLTGIGAYLLRTDRDSSAFGRILSYLVTLTTARRDRLPGWWVGHDPRRGQSLRFPGGHGNLGAAHGITGPLLLLAQAARRGITVDGQQDAIRTICDHLAAWQQDTGTGPWWPEHLTRADVADGRLTHNHGPGRPSWCYGTPGIARAGQLAAIALADPALQQHYEHALARALTDPVQLAQVTDPGLCHGWAGIYQSAARAAADCHTPALKTLLQPLGDALTSHARHATGPGFLNGAAGTALALTTHTTGQPPTSGWDACLLVD